MADEEKRSETTEEETQQEESASAEGTESTESATEDTASESSSQEKEAASSESTSSEEVTESASEVEVPEKFKDIVERIENMSVLDLHELVKLLEQKFEVSAQAVAVAGGGGDAGDEEEEQTAFTVELQATGDQKVGVIKVVKEALGLGLKEAKAMVEELPAPVKEGVSKDEANELKGKLEEAGATVEVK